MKNPVRIIKNFLGSLRGYSGCLRCGDSWSWKKDHSIPCDEHGSGIFPLCEECWLKIDKDEKIFWVKELENWWQSMKPLNEENRLTIVNAIKTIEQGN